jgi:hypothetical protein
VDQADSAAALTSLKSTVKAVTVKVLGGKDLTARDTSTTGNFVLPKVGFIAFS